MTIHPTAQKVQDRLHERGLQVDVQELPDSTRTVADAAAAVGCEAGQIVKSLLFLLGEEPTVVLCAGDRRVDTAKLGEGARTATAKEVRAATGFAVGGVPPLAHDRDLRTLVDESLRRFDSVWCAAGTPHAVFEARLDDLLGALPGVAVLDVTE